ncbi:hypothetical protein JQ604_23655 [Bradyrhizobium jicamae]|uniref:hypothetical protein n=1 Tax=Bradyrhizobium jicamae TaxID=280332 RepID=UPI001BA959DF|nr:hypothetical protein [Bradyrhizobium jicamae]MBR0755192.1 hypothetical protein [Bradyrhizobium jicamae]
MRPAEADPAAAHYRPKIHPLLTSAFDEVCGTAARLLAYVMTLALMAIGGLYLWQQLPDATAEEPAEQTWNLATRSAPAFVVSQLDPRDKTDTYEIFRHPQGGRKDVFRWADADKKPTAELEIYRFGSELAAPATLDLAGRMELSGRRELEAAGIIDSKFGGVALLRPVGGSAGRTCLGFLKQVREPNVRLSGWTCQGATVPAQRAAIGCMLNRLTLLAAGNDGKLAELFAHAELKRTDCAGTPALSADWVMGSENPRLRGAL